MNEHEQVRAFGNDLDALVDRHRREFDLSYAAAVGVLHMKAHLLCSEAEERGDEES